MSPFVNTTTEWPVTAIDRVLFVAGTQVNVTECPPNSNGGLKVEEYQSITGNTKGQPWCASFVAFCGRVALKNDWPLPLTGGCQALYEKAKDKGLVKDTPTVGDVFLLWFPKLNRFAHTGFIEAIRDGTITTIEGNTSGAGSREGWGVFRRTRIFGATDRFIRWAR